VIPRQQNEQRLMIVTGIIQQLMHTRTHKLFKNFTISTSEFSLLSHFSHKPERSWIISELVEVMEMNQPGITKLVASLSEKSALSAKIDEFDKRKRHLTITQKGLQLYNDIMQKLQPDISLCFADWQDKELQQMLKHSEKLMEWLDENRL
jgi:DNA-binding MarR family transcriptional regulator